MDFWYVYLPVLGEPLQYTITRSGCLRNSARGYGDWNVRRTTLADAVAWAVGDQIDYEHRDWPVVVLGDSRAIA